MKKPPKYLLLAYIIWCSIHLFVGFSTWLQDGWIIDGEIWPLAGTKFVGYYDIVEMVIYVLLPLIIWAIYSKILKKYY